MFGRPRCREWTPLATQQLRLRSLIQIVGYNIRPPEGCVSHCSFYITLHHTTMSAPFYTSERISSPHPKWKEIDSELIQRMSSTNVVIRIWCHILHSANDIVTQDTVIQTWGVYFSGLRYIGANLALNFTSDSFKSNTLVFQLHGGYFCSYKSLKLDVIPPENELEHGSLSSDSSGRTNLSRVTLEPKHIQNRVKDGRSVSPSTFTRKVEKEYSKSNSPVDRGFRQNFPTLKNSASLNIGQSQRDSRRRDDSNERKKAVDPNYIYEHSPDSLDVTHDVNGALSKNASNEDLIRSEIDLSETAENYDLRSQVEGEPKCRYLALNFLKSEIRPSYNASKLQKLHLLQYSIKKRQEAVQEIKERIYQKSALTNDSWPQPDELDVRLKLKCRSQRNLFSPDDVEKETTTSRADSSVRNGRLKEDKPLVSNGPRLTLKLNDLLSFKSKPSPFQRAEHVRLTKQLEILRFKRIILSDERDNKFASIRRLKERRAKLFEENQDIGSELMENYHSLSRRSECIKENRQSCAALRELAARTHAALASLRCELLASLHEIFYIQQKNDTTWSIIDVPLPICEDDCPRNTNAVTDSVAAGFAAQATCLAAAFLNQPLRYKITLLGSASKILDITPDLPDPNIPMFARGGDVTLFLYAMFLLNKCIAQLLRGRGLPIADMRTTLANLQRLLLTPSNLSDTSKMFGTYRWIVENNCPRTQSLRSLVATDRVKYRQFNRFKDSVDGQSPQSALNLKRHRHSRSVGSYNDDQGLSTLDVSTTSIMGSEPNIYNMKLTETVPTELSNNVLKQHNSDSEIARLTDDIDEGKADKVIFTLGEDAEADTESDNIVSLVNQKEKLVRLSSNNCDELGISGIEDNMKRICSEIENFCSSSVNKNVHEALDVVKLMDSINVDTVESDNFNSLNVNCDDFEDRQVCDLSCANEVTDVIVIPSAEASVEIGQIVVESDEPIL
ncbi:unnamed protein product [Diatraea saccharalis]|uniref:UV radiation resistance-associated gene protein n=1 Tax=Diatraea saccharalis TaxID=40085 RepID=A0A9N9R5D7_9NEOP|nr:unnamed protein product [Diatraea saccharalis]